MKKTLPIWNPETFFTKVSKGSFAAKGARIDVYKNNCEIFKAGGYVSLNDKEISLKNSGMLENTVVYDSMASLPQKLNPVPETKTGVMNTDSITLGRCLQLKGYNPAVLNLADAYTACGWYYRGSNAQEESLCRQSSLSQSLFQYYDKKNSEASGVEFKRAAYPLDINHGAIYSPDVTVFRKGPQDGYALLDEPYNLSFISCPALDFNEKHGKNLEYKASTGGFTDEGREIMLNKIRTIYSAAILGGHDSLVLGAFGCGAFRLNPGRVASMFKEVLEEDSFRNRFRLVCFAILERDDEVEFMGKFAPFYRTFGKLSLNTIEKQ